MSKCATELARRNVMDKGNYETMQLPIGKLQKFSMKKIFSETPR